MNNLSVIVQGAIDKEITPLCLSSIRKYLPDAYIILSTWKNSDINSLDVDKVIFNEDPGSIARMYAQEKNINDNLNNINRQIISTLNGLKAAKTKYALKIRTDFVIHHTSFLKYFDKFNKRTEDFCIFKHRVLSICGDKPSGRVFFPYDFLFYGLTEDLLSLFDISLMTKNDAEWFSCHNPVNPKVYQTIEGLFKYIPEQHIWLSALSKKYPDIWNIAKDCSDTNQQSIKITEQSFVNNLVCLDFSQYGIYPLKPSLYWLYTENRSHIFHFQDWEHLYKQYCDPSYQCCYSWQKKLNLEYNLYKLKKHKQKYKNSNFFNKLIYFGKILVDFCRIGSKIIFYYLKKLSFWK